MPRTLAALALVSCAFLAGQDPTEARRLRLESPESKNPFLRVERDVQGEPLALQTSIVSYVPENGKGDLVVDLIGAVHIGDGSYYEQLNREFESYDVLLYELVAEKGTRIPQGGRGLSENPLGLVQDLMPSMMGLESQTRRIDYTRKNFVHADMSPSEMKEAMRRRGDDTLTIILGVAADMLRENNREALRREEEPESFREESAPLDFLSALSDPSRLKRTMAEQFERMDGTMGLGSALTNLLITDRNQAALRVFQRELTKGHRRIGIFYGAAHMADFDRRLKAEFGLERKKVRWLTAWDLRPRRAAALGGAGRDDLSTLLELLGRLLKDR